MILQTMSPDEKVREIEKIVHAVNVATQAWVWKHPKIWKVKNLPAMFVFEHEIDTMGKWNIVVVAENKNNLKKGILAIQAYQTFYVKSKDPKNSGAGIWCMNAENGAIVLHEYSPHYFNRIRERFIKPKGIVQPLFGELVKRVLRLHFDAVDETVVGLQKTGIGNLLSLVHDENFDRQGGYDNLIAYHHEGISLGVSAAARRFFHYTTFVGNDLLKENQIRRKEESLRGILSYRLKEKNDPFGATYDEFVFRSRDEYEKPRKAISM